MLVAAELALREKSSPFEHGPPVAGPDTHEVMAGTLGAPKPTSAFILDGLPFAVEANKLVVASLSR